MLEIDETTRLEARHLAALRDALAKMDMDMAFDDFGGGQTRLVALSNTPPDYLK